MKLQYMYLHLLFRSKEPMKLQKPTKNPAAMPTSSSLPFFFMFHLHNLVLEPSKYNFWEAEIHKAR